MGKEKFINFARKVLGNSLYSKLRSKYMLRDYNTLFPLFVPHRFEVNWDLYKKHEQPIRAVYIVSPMQRSGTNFLSRLIGLHPKLNFPEGENFPTEHYIQAHAEQIKKYAQDTVLIWGKWTKDSSTSLEDQVKNLTARMGNGVLDYFEEALSPGELLLMKTPDCDGVEDYFHMFPNTKVIILNRDGRDTVESFCRSWGGDNVFESMTRRWKNRVQQIESLKRRAKASGYGDQIMELTYEDVNQNQEQKLREVCQFLQINEDEYPWDQLQNVPILGSSEHRGGETDVNWKPVERDETFKPSNKWKDWSSGKKKFFKKVAGEELILLGYSEDDNW